MEQNFETCLYNVVDAAKIQWSGRLFYHAIE